MGVLLMQNDPAIAEHKAAELASLIANHEIAVEGGTVRVTVSYGVHGFAQGDTAGEALEAADRAMYRSKTASRLGK